MESLGEKLRTARETKGYTHDQISRDTNISSRYLIAMEEENFSAFPGEPYLLGFLRTYGEYLGLDSQELLANYRNLKIQELPTPVEQLLRPPPKTPSFIRYIIPALIVMGAIGAGVVLFLKRPRTEQVRAAATYRATEYTMDSETLERRFYPTDSLLVTYNGSTYKVTLSNLGEVVTIATPSGSAILDLSQDTNIDLDGDGLPDLRITVADFVRNEPATGVLLRFDREIDSQAADQQFIAANLDATPSTGTSNSSSSPAQIIFTSPNAYPFTLQILFQGYCMFRYEVLAERDRQGQNERYYSRNEEFNIPAQNGVRMWLSNAAAVRIQAIGGGRTVPLELGGAGEVIVADVRWIRDEDGRYRLALLKLD